MRVLILGSAVLSLVSTHRFNAPSGVLELSLRFSSEVDLSKQNNTAFLEDMGSSHAIGPHKAHFISLSHTPVRQTGSRHGPQTKCWLSVGKKVRSFVQIQYRLHSSHLP
ncbi:hypothetical protein AVEN_200041-1 [Araneus ventricosus]|uniref:Secreted protein n=1 Tax=Araneus ventricosus TaxID=182803 RepID=A0A4Y2E3I5_ARAVE|nr:hypothetical protein AVEN_200041-1 [Araneus ventricosus]